MKNIRHETTKRKKLFVANNFVIKLDVKKGHCNSLLCDIWKNHDKHRGQKEKSDINPIANPCFHNFGSILRKIECPRMRNVVEGGDIDINSSGLGKKGLGEK